MEKFKGGSVIFNDYFLIEVKDNEAMFYYQPNVNRFYERKRLISIGEIEEDDEETLEPFYWIPVFNWDKKVKNHLLRKSWVTQEMIDYIETSINKQKQNTKC